MTTEHEHHTPGDDEDIRTISLAMKHVQRIKQLIVLSNFTKVAQDDILRELEPAPACYRRPHYEDIRNIAKRQAAITYRRSNDDHESFNAWLTQLGEEGYLVFLGHLGAYGARADRFAKGFLSQAQYSQMESATTFSMDATYNVVQNREIIMYSLVVAHRNTGQGYPVAYMFTNDHSVGPLVQWLAFLKSNANMNPTQMTIDCSIPEVNAIKATFPNVAIRFCAFHVAQAMKRYVEKHVFLPDVPPSAQSSYRQQLIGDLRMLIVQDSTNHMKE